MSFPRTVDSSEVAQPVIFAHSSRSRNKLGLVPKAESKELEVTVLFLAYGNAVCSKSSADLTEAIF